MEKFLPLGGVGVHLSRLMQNLKFLNINFKFIYLSPKHLPLIFLKLIAADTVHLHSSSPIIRISFGLFCYPLNKNLIITYHGDLGRFSFLLNFLDLMSVYLCKYPVVCNEKVTI